MQQAILIAGDEERHAGRVNKFLEFIQDNLEICRYSLNTIKGLDKKSMYGYLAQELQLPRLKDEPVLILYNGHGTREGWATRDGEIVMPYRGLAKIVESFVHGPFILINDCCHAESVIPAFENSSMPRENIEIFAACGVEEVSFGSMTGDILKTWQKGSCFDPCDYPLYRVYTDELREPYQAAINTLKAWADYKISKFLYWLAPGHFAMRSCRIHIMVIQGNINRRYAEKEGPIYDRIRWGAKLDNYFFPFSERI